MPIRSLQLSTGVFVKLLCMFAIMLAVSRNDFRLSLDSSIPIVVGIVADAQGNKAEREESICVRRMTCLYSPTEFCDV